LKKGKKKENENPAFRPQKIRSIVIEFEMREKEEIYLLRLEKIVIAIVIALISTRYY